MNPRERIESAFDSDEDDSSRDWTKLENGVRNDGMRQGIEAGKEALLQFGFNSAFREAVKMAVAGGKLQGNICAHLSLPSPRATLATSETSSAMPQQESNSLTASSVDPAATDLLQKLLVNNTELTSSIPLLLATKTPGSSLSSYLKSSDFTNLAASLIPHQKNDASFNKDVPPAEFSSSACARVLKPASSEGEVQPHDGKDFLSCEDICSNREHFWDQLHSFQSQVRTLGVASPMN